MTKRTVAWFGAVAVTATLGVTGTTWTACVSNEGAQCNEGATCTPASQNADCGPGVCLSSGVCKCPNSTTTGAGGSGSTGTSSTTATTGGSGTLCSRCVFGPGGAGYCEADLDCVGTNPQWLCLPHNPMSCIAGVACPAPLECDNTGQCTCSPSGSTSSGTTSTSTGTSTTTGATTGSGGPTSVSCDAMVNGFHECALVTNPDSTDVQNLQQECTLLSGTEGTSCSSTNRLGQCSLMPAGMTPSVVSYYSDTGTTAAQAQQACTSGGGTWTPG
jgi:hypothetical protein